MIEAVLFFTFAFGVLIGRVSANIDRIPYHGEDQPPA